MKTKGKKKKWLVPALVGTAIAGGLLLLTGKSSASNNVTPIPPPTPTPPNPNPNPSPNPKPNPFPPGTALATVIPNSKGGVNARTGPDVSFPLVGNNDAFNGTTVGVLQTGIASTTPLSKEWWKIITPGGSTGFASAVGPAGESNFSPTGSIPLPGGGSAQNGGLEQQLPSADGNSGGGPVELPPDVVAGVYKHVDRPWSPWNWR